MNQQYKIKWEGCGYGVHINGEKSLVECRRKEGCPHTRNISRWTACNKAYGEGNTAVPRGAYIKIGPEQQFPVYAHEWIALELGIKPDEIAIYFANNGGKNERQS